MDYLGIITMISGALVPLIYYCFSCSPRFQKAYWITLSVVACLCAVCILQRFSGTPIIRVLLCSLLVVLAVVAVLQSIGQDDWNFKSYQKVDLKAILITLALDGLGALVYITKVSNPSLKALLI
jgi:predicted membrane channel-forming protein YqfA (hemolysin III family)